MYDGIKLDKDGYLVNPNVHDAYITGLVLLKEKRLLILIQLVNGEIFGLILHNATRLKVNEFREGNVILDINVSEGEGIDINGISNLYSFSCDVADVPMNFVNQLINENKKLVVINPSYGCELICICSDLEVCMDWEKFII
jgi:hypothetical protein